MYLLSSVGEYIICCYSSSDWRVIYVLKRDKLGKQSLHSRRSRSRSAVLTAYASRHATWFLTKPIIFRHKNLIEGQTDLSFQRNANSVCFSDRIFTFVNWHELFPPFVCMQWDWSTAMLAKVNSEICEYVCLPSCIQKTNQSKAMFDPTHFGQTHHALFVW